MNWRFKTSQYKYWRDHTLELLSETGLGPLFWVAPARVIRHFRHSTGQSLPSGKRYQSLVMKRLSIRAVPLSIRPNDASSPIKICEIIAEYDRRHVDA